MNKIVNKTQAKLPDRYEYRLDLRKAATPKLLKSHPIHHWFFFPHSYSPELVEAVLDDWSLPEESKLIDPFVGAGTTLLVARERGLSATGFDLSPVSILVSNAKVRDYDIKTIRQALDNVTSRCEKSITESSWRSDRMKRALSESERAEFWSLSQTIMGQPRDVRDLLLLALIRIVRDFSRAVADGGWFRWVEKPDQGNRVRAAFQTMVEQIIEELKMDRHPLNGQLIEARKGDARNLSVPKGEFAGLITSPPYPNRHDYSRIFHIELLLLGEDESDIIDFRHHSMRSHVEALKPTDVPVSISKYVEPEKLTDALNHLPEKSDDRVPSLLRGYFEDLYTTMVVARSTLKPKAGAAFVVGNVRYGGILIPVDEILVDVGKQAGFLHDKTWVIRLRGNSAQQMGSFGREPSRESVVFLRKTR